MNHELQNFLKAFSIKISPVFESIQKNLESLQPSVLKGIKSLQEIQKQYEPSIRVIGKEITKFANNLQQWNQKWKLDIVKMAEDGWFPNWHTFFYKPQKELKNIDEFMMAQIDDSFISLQEEIIKHCPNRKHIIETAFALHESGNYIAAIPLFFTQSDGICSEKIAHLFAGKKADEVIKEMVISNELPLNFITSILIEPFKIDLQISKGSDKASKSKHKGPNRHGIIHGNRKHLDYGTRINSYKALSLLAFVVFIFKDMFDDVNFKK